MTNNKSAPKRKKGRPSPYKVDFVDQAYHLARLGATDVDLGKAFKVTVSTVRLWKKNHPAFSVALKRGKDDHDTEIIEGSLRSRATGYDCIETKVFNDKGNGIITKDVTKHYPPDVTAIIFWLQNRQPERWRDKRYKEHDESAPDSRPSKQDLENAKKAIEKQLDNYSE